MKPIVKEAKLSLGHLEAALVSYLKPFFPEALEIVGVDMTLPLDGQNTVGVKIYMTPKAPAKEKEAKVEEAKIIKLTPPKNNKKKSDNAKAA